MKKEAVHNPNMPRCEGYRTIHWRQGGCNSQDGSQKRLQSLGLISAVLQKDWKQSQMEVSSHSARNYSSSNGTCDWPLFVLQCCQIWVGGIRQERLVGWCLWWRQNYNPFGCPQVSIAAESDIKPSRHTVDVSENFVPMCTCLNSLHGSKYLVPWTFRQTPKFADYVQNWTSRQHRCHSIEYMPYILCPPPPG